MGVRGESLLQANKSGGWKKKLSKFTLPLIMVLMWLIVFMFEPRFLSFENLSNLGRQTSIIAIVAIAQTFVIITRGIDLSVGSTVGLASIISAKLLVAGMPVIPTILISLLVGAAVGIVNGIIVHDAKITPFIATLGMMTILRGATLLQSEGKLISNVPKSISKISESSFLGIPVLLYFLLFIAIIAAIIIKYTVFGRNLFAIGSSEDSARLSGVNVRATTYGAYMVSGLLSAVAGFLLTARLASGIPTAGTGYELDAIASAVIGGASLFGAQGSIIGTVIGSFIMTTLRNAGNLLGIEAFWLQIAVGTLLIIVVFFDQLRKRVK
ncbi:ABC transporter permease [Cohnella terricola]|uniref:ABC transporter permease n=1 Tax=Cohnella terricola TaxID=1289167 RepID=A0A559J8Q6_9BACL|nr:ABC transporter permease [Cohnella terricola]TVX96254.1 ABC transporter permease [Cohnella terricola]